LEVWQKSMSVAELAYRVAMLLPRSEMFGLATQIRRASVSVPSNIAEGHQLPTAAYRHHVSVALGSLAELDTQMELAVRVGLLSPECVRDVRLEVAGIRLMLLRLRASLKAAE